MLQFKKISIVFLLLACVSINIQATEHEQFSNLVSKLISVSQNVKECKYDNNQKLVYYQTYDHKERKVRCLWFPQNENNQISIDETVWMSLKDTDYIMIGYGLTPSNPLSYYFIPLKKMSKTIKLNKFGKYKLSNPIINNKF